MSWAAAAFLVGAFFYLLHLLRVPARAADVVARARQAVAVIRARELDDAQKEAAVQAHSKALFGQFLVITIFAAVALAAPLSVIAALQTFGVVDFDEALARTMSWQVLVGATVLGLLMWRLLRGRG